uniref:Epsin-3-like n=1 Tax=Pundamilia nyererei TaxID=303518 RepID=A0A3B4F7K5_9CICH
MTTSALRRQVKNIVHNYSEAEIKVREATSNDPWGPSSSLMSEIADLTFNVVAFAEVMGMVWKRLNDSGKNWRHVYKALTLLDYLLKTGSERVAQQCRENAFTIQTLRDFQYVDRDGRDQGANVREKARQLVCLLRDEERLRQERSQALKTKERMAGGGSGGGGGPSMAVLYGEEFSRSRGSPSSFNSSSSSPRAASDLEKARPQTSGEEELQLQLALAMSREESQKVKQHTTIHIHTHTHGMIMWMSSGVAPVHIYTQISPLYSVPLDDYSNENENVANILNIRPPSASPSFPCYHRDRWRHRTTDCSKP